MDENKKTEGTEEKKAYKVLVAFEGHTVGQTVQLTEDEAKPLIDSGKVEASA